MEFSLGDITVTPAMVGDGRKWQFEVRSYGELIESFGATMPPEEQRPRDELERIATLYLRHAPYMSRMAAEVMVGLSRTLGRDAPGPDDVVAWLGIIDEATEARLIARPPTRGSEVRQDVVDSILRGIVEEMTVGKAITAADLPMHDSSAFVETALGILRQAYPNEVVATLDLTEIGEMVGLDLVGDQVAIRIGDRYYDPTQTLGTPVPERLGFVQDAIRDLGLDEGFPEPDSGPDEDVPQYAAR